MSGLIQPPDLARKLAVPAKVAAYVAQRAGETDRADSACSARPALRQRLEHALGLQIKEAQGSWADWSQSKRARRVDEFRLLRDCLAHVSGELDPVIPSPWTSNDAFDSMRDYIHAGEWLKSTNGMLTVLDSKLARATRVTERTLGKYGRLPAKLN